MSQDSWRKNQKNPAAFPVRGFGVCVVLVGYLRIRHPRRAAQQGQQQNYRQQYNLAGLRIMAFPARIGLL
jgi:hypothetical protein